jgi:hypothetical protein
MSSDRDKLKYSIFYFPGSGGVIVSWLLALAHDYTLLPTALACFPKKLKDNYCTIRNEKNQPLAGWIFHENVYKENPYCTAWWINMHGPEENRTTPVAFGNIQNLARLSSKHTTNIFLLMSNKARTRACYEKGNVPFRTHDNINHKVIKNEKIIYKEKQLKIIREFDKIDNLFNYNSIFQAPEKYIGEIETIIDHPLTDAHTEAIEKLVNRYIQITPPKLLKIINDENKLS